jgi:hypothetical protein
MSEKSYLCTLKQSDSVTELSDGEEVIAWLLELLDCGRYANVCSDRLLMECQWQHILDFYINQFVSAGCSVAVTNNAGCTSSDSFKNRVIKPKFQESAMKYISFLEELSAK